MTADSQQKLLNATDPALTYKVTSGSLVNGDGLGGALTAARRGGRHVPDPAGHADGRPQLRTQLHRRVAEDPVGMGRLSQPINDTAHQAGVAQSKFKLGQTIPAKFVIKDARGAVVQQSGSPTFSRSGNLGSCDAQTEPETVIEVVAPDAGVSYAWDGSQYHYNWSTKSLTAGEYRIYANLADGTSATLTSASRGSDDRGSGTKGERRQLPLVVQASRGANSCHLKQSTVWSFTRPTDCMNARSRRSGRRTGSPASSDPSTSRPTPRSAQEPLAPCASG